ncbi:hypothetical protein GCM10010345_73160 [Streptomyces canarius]|uniref:Uncharacterized protein n=1 Tax=Streptomyces canarius TaxID=285453 RepID=A0ABQ3D4C2_9ACTN|nr:hypothetical protein GCM10010345_73160 [Streptomyces canarius]
MRESAASRAVRRTARGRGRNDTGERGEWTERVEPGLSTGMTCLRGSGVGGVTWDCDTDRRPTGVGMPLTTW